jgi:hypothetical protein
MAGSTSCTPEGGRVIRRVEPSPDLMTIPAALKSRSTNRDQATWFRGG